MKEKLFGNSGEKLKKLANITFWLEIISSVILAFCFGLQKEWGRYSYHYEFNAVYFFGFLLGMPLASYLSSLGMYAFGELVEDIEIWSTLEFLKPEYADTTKTPQPVQDLYTSLEKLAKLHAQGVLDDEEYGKMKADLLEKV